MNRPSWTLALTLAVPSLLAAGCRDSNQSYIGFDAAPDTASSDVRSDGATSETTPGDAARSEVATDAVASETPPSSDAGSDLAADGDAARDDAAPDTEPGQ